LVAAFGRAVFSAVNSNQRKSAMPRLPRTVLYLGLVSFITDLSSEMIYPLLPLFLATVLGAGAATLGIIEGVAESTAALLKVFSGIWTDRTEKRKPLILTGYGLSSSVRPLIGLAGAWPAVLLIRFLDRMGKGLRTSPRDALIADVTPAAQRGMAYGFHRAMDHAGAVAGPLVAAALLRFAGLPLRTVFLLAAIPAVVVMLVLVTGVPEPPHPPTPATRAQVFSLRERWQSLGADFRRLLAALLVFTLGNSTDAFLILRLSHAGVSAAWIATLWSLHHVVKMLATYFGGRWADTFHPRHLILAGWGLYAAVYAAFAWIDSAAWLIVVFLVYGVYFGLTEPCERAWVASLSPAPVRGSAFGFYHGVIGLAALPASVLFGFLWQRLGMAAAFTSGAILALAAVLLLLRVGRNPSASSYTVKG
jgi:MFS family permease